eukprot:gene22955-30139_t
MAGTRSKDPQRTEDAPTTTTDAGTSPPVVTTTSMRPRSSSPGSSSAAKKSGTASSLGKGGGTMSHPSTPRVTEVRPRIQPTSQGGSPSQAAMAMASPGASPRSKKGASPKRGGGALIAHDELYTNKGGLGVVDAEREFDAHGCRAVSSVDPWQERWNMALLVLLYLMQGVPLGLTLGSMPFMLQSKMSYSQVGFFSIAAYPYSLKLFWSPIVDSLYNKRIGRRKSWIIPVQLITGWTMIAYSAAAQQEHTKQQSKPPAPAINPAQQHIRSIIIISHSNSNTQVIPSNIKQSDSKSASITPAAHRGAIGKRAEGSFTSKKRTRVIRTHSKNLAIIVTCWARTHDRARSLATNVQWRGGATQVPDRGAARRRAEVGCRQAGEVGEHPVREDPRVWDPTRGPAGVGGGSTGTRQPGTDRRTPSIGSQQRERTRAGPPGLARVGWRGRSPACGPYWGYGSCKRLHGGGDLTRHGWAERGIEGSGSEQGGRRANSEREKPRASRTTVGLAGMQGESDPGRGAAAKCRQMKPIARPHRERGGDGEQREMLARGQWMGAHKAMLGWI